MNEIEKNCKHYRLSPQEYERICKLLNRPPKGVEWAIFSALWSEHCSYKSSKIHLKKFKHSSSRVLESEGENAGVVDIGQGERLAFKMESHNHPSFIEPYQGAATGVGGILRDIFTMGARPIALADYLCFGEVSAERMPRLQEGVVRGISGYGNCVGVPTVSGQTESDRSYNRNILVNAMAVGLFKPNDKMALSKAKGPGNWVVYVGAKTGKDGVHGASMASESFDENSDAKKPNVQIGDPFYEKLLIESCLEILKNDLVVCMQDMGAAGLTSSSFEMAAKGGVGMKMHLDKVPLRDSSMNPEEILLSESQERMLLVCEPKNFTKISEIFDFWGLEATHIGEVTSQSVVTLLWKNEVLTEIDPALLVDQAPMYERPYRVWQPHSKKEKIELNSKKSLKDLLSMSLTHERGHSRQEIYQQYDQRVGAKTIRDAQQAVAFLKLPSKRALAINVGCRPAWMRLDAQIGAFDAIAYPMLQMAAKGAKALAVTDCLNFGNPEKIEIMTEFVASVEALAMAAKKFDTPVVSGNVSFYNETLGHNITSTPATGLVGLKANLENIPFDEFSQDGDVVLLLKLPQVEALCWSAEIYGERPYFKGELNLDQIKTFSDSLCDLISAGRVHSSKVIGNGGYLRNLALMSRFCGFEGNEKFFDKLSATDLVAERLYEVVVSVPASETEDIKNKFQTEQIGQVKKGIFKLGKHLSMLPTEILELYGEKEKDT